MSTAVELFGAPYSVYVRVCLIALAEKHVDHALVPIDVFAESEVKSDLLSLNPFGRIPALRHGEMEIYETDAITGYINEAFDGPALMPEDLRLRARARQIMRLADNEVYRHLVWGVYVPWKDGRPLEGLSRADLILGELERLSGERFMAGPAFSLADAYVYPMLRYFSIVPEGMAKLAAHQPLERWLRRMEERESIRKSQFPDEHAAAASI